MRLKSKLKIGSVDRLGLRDVVLLQQKFPQAHDGSAASSPRAHHRATPAQVREGRLVVALAVFQLAVEHLYRNNMSTTYRNCQYRSGALPISDSPRCLAASLC